MYTTPFNLRLFGAFIPLFLSSKTPSDSYKRHVIRKDWHQVLTYAIRLQSEKNFYFSQPESVDENSSEKKEGENLILIAGRRGGRLGSGQPASGTHTRFITEKRRTGARFVARGEILLSWLCRQAEIVYATCPPKTRSLARCFASPARGSANSDDSIYSSTVVKPHLPAFVATQLLLGSTALRGNLEAFFHPPPPRSYLTHSQPVDNE